MALPTGAQSHDQYMGPVFYIFLTALIRAVSHVLSPAWRRRSGYVVRIVVRRRSRILVVLTSLLVLFSFIFVVAGTPVARATVDDDGPGPSSALDGYGHQYVFWQDSTTTIGEAYYTGGTWLEYTPIKDADIGSEPSVVVSPSQSTGGENPCAYQFLFWVGNGSDHQLHMAYYGTSGWSGPYDLGMGMGLNSFAPSATVYDYSSNSTAIMVAWIVDNYVEYAYSTNTTDPSSWKGPIKISDAGPTNAPAPSLTTVPGPNGQPPDENQINVIYPSLGFENLEDGIIAAPGATTAKVLNLGDGPLGSVPTSYSYFGTLGGVGTYTDFSFWQGTSGGIYGMYYNFVNGFNSGSSAFYAGQLGSTPSVVSDSTGSNVWFYFICSNDTTLCQYYEDTGKLTNLGFKIPIPS